MIYLASPYTDPDKRIEEERYRAVLHCCALMLKRRLWVYSPIVHCHELAKQHELPTDFPFWQNYNFHMMKHARKFFVLNIPGWKESAGVTAELKFAKGNGTPSLLITVVNDMLEYDKLWAD